MTMHDESVLQMLPLANVTHLELHADGVPVTITGLAGDEQPRLELHGDERDHIETTIRNEGGHYRVELEAHRPWHAWFGRHRAGARLFLPMGVDLEGAFDGGPIDVVNLRVGRCEVTVDGAPLRLSQVEGDLRFTTDGGPVTAEGLRGQFELMTDGGPAKLADLRGKLHLITDGGPIHATRLAGAITVTADGGPVNLGIDALDDGVHTVNSDGGPVHITLAPDVRARVEVTAEGGPAHISVPHQPDAPALLRVVADGGPVSVTQHGHAAARQWTNWGATTPMPPVPPVPPIPPLPPLPPLPPTPAFSLADTIGRAVHEALNGAPAAEHDTRPVPDGAGDDRAASADDVPSVAATDEPARPTARSADAARPEVERVLQMVEAGRLSARDAAELLRALGAA